MVGNVELTSMTTAPRADQLMSVTNGRYPADKFSEQTHS